MASPDMPRPLLLGGTTEASALAALLAGAGIRAQLSLAGRTKAPAPQPLPTRIGGFGGAEGLARYLRDRRITHVIDATHPFAAQMSRNAAQACAALNLPLLALSRAPWQPQAGDRWQRMPDIAGAVAALDRPAARVFLAVGRMHLEAFAAQPQHHYLLRLIDAPEAVPLPHSECVVARGPFTLEGDLALMRAHGTELVVAKNAGGPGAVAKIAAARQLGLPVLMIDRPTLPDRAETHDPRAVMRWLGHADLGVKT